MDQPPTRPARPLARHADDPQSALDLVPEGAPRPVGDAGPGKGADAPDAQGKGLNAKWVIIGLVLILIALNIVFFAIAGSNPVELVKP